MKQSFWVTVSNVRVECVLVEAPFVTERASKLWLFPAGLFLVTDKVAPVSVGAVTRTAHVGSCRPRLDLRLGLPHVTCYDTVHTYNKHITLHVFNRRMKTIYILK